MLKIWQVYYGRTDTTDFPDTCIGKEQAYQEWLTVLAKFDAEAEYDERMRHKEEQRKKWSDLSLHLTTFEHLYLMCTRRNALGNGSLGPVQWRKSRVLALTFVAMFFVAVFLWYTFPVLELWFA